MAEALAVVGIVSSIVQVVDFSTKCIERINDFRKHAQEIPKTFQGIARLVPAFADGFKKAQEQLEAYRVPANTQKALTPIVQDALRQMRKLDEMLIKVSPTSKDSSWKRGKKAVLSLGQDNEIVRIEQSLTKNFQLLSQLLLLHQVSNIIPDPPSPQPNSRSNSPELQPPVYEGRKAPIFMLPFARDEHFINRQDVLDRIFSKFTTSRRVAIAGMGGVGKSQIAIEFCYRFKDEEKNCDAHVFWAYASTESRLEGAYKEIARKLCIPGADDPNAEMSELVCEWLSDHEERPWLLVVDNADDASTFFATKSGTSPDGRGKSMAKYLPRSKQGSILITTRDKRVGERLTINREKPIPISPMTDDEAIDLLQAKVSEDAWNDVDARELLKDLAYLPLAITQAAAFISENEDMTISDYVEAFGANDMEVKDLLSTNLEDDRRDMDTENSVMRTWKMSFQQIKKEKPRAAEILSLMAMFDRQGIPRMLLRDRDETEASFRLAIGTLQAFSLITAEKGKDSAFGMHRLVQLSTQTWLENEGTFDEWASKALRTLVLNYPKVEYKTWSLCEQLTPHINTVLSRNFKDKWSRLDSAKLLDDVAWYERKMGRYKVSYSMGMEALRIREELLPEDDIALYDSYETVGHALKRQCEWEKARDYLEKSLHGRERVLGMEHSDTLRSLGDFAYILGELGDLDSAEKMHQREFEYCERVRGPQNHRTLASMESLASVMMDRKQYKAAEKLYRKVLQIRKKMLGDDHPDTLNSLANVSDALIDQGYYPAAKTMIQYAHDQWVNLLGPEHPSAISTLRRLALLADYEENPEKAERLYRQVVELRIKTLGLEHYKTISVMNDLGVSLQDQGPHRYMDAEELYRKAFEAREQMLGSSHPKTLVSLDEIAYIVGKQGRYMESVELYRDCLRRKEQSKGSMDLGTLAGYSNLGCALQNCGEQFYEEAEILLRKAYEGRLNVLGSTDSKTKNSYKFLYDLLALEWKNQEAALLSDQYESAKRAQLDRSEGRLNDTKILEISENLERSAPCPNNIQVIEDAGKEDDIWEEEPYSDEGSDSSEDQNSIDIPGLNMAQDVALKDGSQSVTASPTASNARLHDILTPTSSDVSLSAKQQYEINDLEAENIDLFSILVDRMKSHSAGTITKEPQMQELYDSMHGLGDRLFKTTPEASSPRAMGPLHSNITPQHTLREKLNAALQTFDNLNTESLWKSRISEPPDRTGAISTTPEEQIRSMVLPYRESSSPSLSTAATDELEATTFPWSHQSPTVLGSQPRSSIPSISVRRTQTFAEQEELIWPESQDLKDDHDKTGLESSLSHRDRVVHEMPYGPMQTSKTFAEPGSLASSVSATAPPPLPGRPSVSERKLAREL
ncbi:hypothetical protein MMC25_000539 [Agyrium rufum]|nr:hypothetical protein [Agyrium rufum]